MIMFIVDEVVRRIKHLISTHRGLVVIRDHTDYERLNMVLTTMYENGFKFDVLDMQHQNKTYNFDSKIKDISIISELDKDANFDFIHQYKTVIISNLSIIEISKLSKLNIESQFMQLLFEVLKEGIPIYGISNDLEVKNNLGLQNLVQSLCLNLEEIGLRMIMSNKHPKSLDSQIITLEMVKEIEQRKLIISKSAIVTNAAKDYLIQNNIEIIRK